ncbi:MAG: cob(I)yrinic acid a,c-diamide adenosyltransferase [Bacteroidaceae bacterium]
MKKCKIYTRTGDTGSTSLVGGTRVSKCHPRLEAYGTLDELNSHLGLLSSLLSTEDKNRFGGKLLIIQKKLFNIGGYLATDPTQYSLPLKFEITSEVLREIELWIDELNAELSELHSFIVPGGTIAASQSHICRTVCRRAERNILALESEIQVNKWVLKYINRLSDFLFIFARILNKDKAQEEPI